MKLIDYEFVKDDSPSEMKGKTMYNYHVFEDGIFISAGRKELEVSFPIAECEVRGLFPSCGPLIDFKLPLIPERLIRQMVKEAHHYADRGLETLFHFHWSDLCITNDGWLKTSPEQERTPKSCRPLDAGDGSSYQKVIVEIHSHHSMPARFSPIDDADEQGFRIYGVIGRLDEAPEIRVRVGVYGYFWEFPASFVMELPEGLTDCMEMEEEFADV